MEIRQPLQIYYFILIHFFHANLIVGQSRIIIKNEKMVYALPGEDVILTCSILKAKGIKVTQTQWSEVSNGPTRRIAVYNPRYGTRYTEEVYRYSVSFSNNIQHCVPDVSHSSFTANFTECDQWILRLNNVSADISGIYECSFTTFPAGTSSSEINLVVRNIVVVEALSNQTLEIPCFKGLPSVNLTSGSLKWLLKENENEELLISKPPYTFHGATIDKDRMEMDSENTLIISPVSIFDDGKKFVCSVAHHPERIMKTTTEVKVFVKPEILIAINASFPGKATFTCVVRKAFPKPNLLWYLDGDILKEQIEGIIVENEDTTFAGGFYEMRSFLTIWRTTQPFLNPTLKCTSIYPFPGNQTQNISSEEIFLPHGWQPTTLESLKTSSHVPSSMDPPSEKPWHATTELQNNTLAKPSSYSTVPQDLQDSAPTTQKSSVHVTHLLENTTPSQGDLLTRTELTMLMSNNLHTTNGWYNSTGNLSTETAAKLITLANPDHPLTVNSRFNNNGTATLPEHSYFSWPALVAALLLFCTFLIFLGVRKWCQYQKEIMNRPPSFKPPPPPIKYTPIQGLDGIYTSCNELENL